MENVDADKIALVLLLAVVLTLCQENRLSKKDAQKMQDSYMVRMVDPLPLLETLKDCDSCPLIYIPVCGTDNRTYSNLCWMSCVRNRYKKPVFHAYDGHCHQFIMPFDY